MSQDLVFFHAPQTRSSGVAVLLDELGAPHERRILNLKAGEQRDPAFLAVNPMGKVPAILHRGALVTEQPAIYLYLSELFPEAGLAPAVGDRERAAFVRWLAFYGGSFEPALVDKAMGREPGRVAMSPYGSYQAVIDALSAQLRAGPYIGGTRMTAADVLWGAALGWTMGFGIVPSLPEFKDYAERMGSRPAAAKVAAEDARLVAEQAEVAGVTAD